MDEPKDLTVSLQGKNITPTISVSARARKWAFLTTPNNYPGVGVGPPLQAPVNNRIEHVTDQLGERQDSGCGESDGECPAMTSPKKVLLEEEFPIVTSPAKRRIELLSLTLPSPDCEYLTADGKREVIVHVTYLKIGEINTLKEQFDADILVRLKWREPELDNVPLEKSDTIDWKKMWNPKVFIDNAVGEPKQSGSTLMTKSPEGHSYVIERKRYRGTFMEQMELWEFPFDVQDLSIMVMSDLDATELDLEEDPEEIHKIQRQSFIDEQEWYLYKWIEGEKMELAPDRADPSIRRPAVCVKARVGRRPQYFIWNIFSVTFLLACLSFITFAVIPLKVENRLQLGFTLVLTTVAFKFVVNQSLPRISYLTYLDRYIIATMITLASVCLWHGLTSLMDPDNRNRDYIALAVFVFLYAVYNIQFFLRIYVIPYRRRREMKVKERQYVQFVAKQVEERELNKRKSKRISRGVESDVGEDVPLTKVTTG